MSYFYLQRHYRNLSFVLTRIGHERITVEWDNDRAYRCLVEYSDKELGWLVDVRRNAESLAYHKKCSSIEDAIGTALAQVYRRVMSQFRTPAEREADNFMGQRWQTDEQLTGESNAR